MVIKKLTSLKGKFMSAAAQLKQEEAISLTNENQVILRVIDVNTYSYFYEYRAVKLATKSAMESYGFNREDCLLYVLQQLLKQGFPYEYSDENDGCIKVLRPSTGEELCKVI